MSQRSAIARLCGAGLILGAGLSPAGATVVAGTFSGVMQAGSTDTGNYFGGGDLGGQAVTGTFTYDSASLAANNCPGVAGEGCFFGQVGITATIAGHSVTFPNAPGGDALYGIVQYGGFPVSNLGVDQFTISSFYGTYPSIGLISVTLTSTISNFIPDPLDTTSSFTLAAADIGSSSDGSMELPLGGSEFETLLFQFNSPGSSASRAGPEHGPDVPEPASLLLLGTAAAAAATLRRRGGAAPQHAA